MTKYMEKKSVLKYLMDDRYITIKRNQNESVESI